MLTSLISQTNVLSQETVPPPFGESILRRDLAHFVVLQSLSHDAGSVQQNTKAPGKTNEGVSKNAILVIFYYKGKICVDPLFPCCVMLLAL